MKKLIALLLTMNLITSCNSNWGQKAQDFAHTEAPPIVDKLSQKDLEDKWNKYFLMETSYGIAQTNLANNIVADLKGEDLTKIESDPKRLIEVVKRLEQDVNVIFDANAAYYAAKGILDRIVNSCNDESSLRIYKDSKSYLASSLQITMPDMNFSYGVVLDSKGDAVVLFVENAIKNITAFLGQKENDENKAKADEAQRYIGNITLDDAQFAAYSKQYCLENIKYFKDTIDILRSNVENLGTSLNAIYASVVSVRNALMPFIIENRLKNDPGYQGVINLEKDNEFLQRMRDISVYLKNIKYMYKKNLTPADYAYIEETLEDLNRYLNELAIYKSTFLGSANQDLIDSAIKYTTSQKERMLYLYR